MAGTRSDERVRNDRINIMKKDLHPKYHEKAKIACACGAIYEVGSTEPEISVELCANCHPLYTGKQKIVDTARRVEKFMERSAKKAASTTNKAEKSLKRAAKKASSDGKKMKGMNKVEKK